MNWQRWAHIVRKTHRIEHLLQVVCLSRCISKHSTNKERLPSLHRVVSIVSECFSLGKRPGNCKRVCNCLSSASVDLSILGETDQQRLTFCLLWPRDLVLGLVLSMLRAVGLERLFSSFLPLRFSRTSNFNQVWCRYSLWYCFTLNSRLIRVDITGSRLISLMRDRG